MALMQAKWINKDSDSLEDSSGALQVKLDGSGALAKTSSGVKIDAASVTDAMLAGSIADGNLVSSYIYANGDRSMGADLDLNSNKITNLTDGSSNGDAVNFGQLQDAVTQGKVWREVIITKDQLLDGASGGIYGATVLKLSSDLTAGNLIKLHDGSSEEIFTGVDGAAGAGEFSVDGTINDTLVSLSSAINVGSIAVSSTTGDLESIDGTNNVLVLWQDTIAEPTRVYGNADAASVTVIADVALLNLYESMSADMVALPSSDPAATNFGFGRAKASLSNNETHQMRITDESYTWDTDQIGRFYQ